MAAEMPDHLEQETARRIAAGEDPATARRPATAEYQLAARGRERGVIIPPMDFSQAMRVLAAFAGHGVEYVLVGSMAMAAQGLVRATRDMDVFVASDPANVERLKAALRELFEDPSIDEIRSEDLAGDYPAVQYVPPGGDYWIDILARLGEAFRFADLEAEVLEVEGLRVKVATPRMLYRMKRDTVRPQDRLDAAELRRRFGLEED